MEIRRRKWGCLSPREAIMILLVPKSKLYGEESIGVNLRAALTCELSISVSMFANTIFLSYGAMFGEHCGETNSKNQEYGEEQCSRVCSQTILRTFLRTLFPYQLRCVYMSDQYCNTYCTFSQCSLVYTHCDLFGECRVHFIIAVQTSPQIPLCSSKKPTRFGSWRMFANQYAY